MKNAARFLLLFIFSSLTLFAFQNCGPATLVGTDADGTSLSSTSQEGAALPDLVFSDFSLNPTTPIAGDSVTFSVTITNQSQTSTPSGIPIDVIFLIDGVEVGRASSDGTSLPPGSTLRIQSDSGVSGTGSWISTSGLHSFTAKMSSIGIKEVSTNNNQFDIGFTVQNPTAPCQFQGTTLASGQTVVAYQNSSVPFGSSCVSETRVCTNGSLSGSYQNASCSVGSAANCLLNGATIANGQSVTTYQATTVPYGSLCSSQVRTCSNGTLSGTYQYTSCSVEAASTCSFNGATIAHGQTVTAYQASNVPSGSVCSSQIRTCNNGTLSGTYQYASCSVTAAATCQFNGSTITSGQTVTAYQSSSVAYGSSCTSEVRTCTNGTLSGTYQFGSCSVAAPVSCQFNGSTISHGQNVTAYQSSSVAYGSSCLSQSRTCNNGTLSGTYQFSSCSVSAPVSCSFNGTTVAHGQGVTAYQYSSVAYGGTCSYETRVCTNGALSGSYQYSSCSESAPSNCLFNGATVASGQSITAYLATSVPYGSTCGSQTRTCTNGILSGTYQYASCSVAAPVSCQFNGVTIPSGQTVTAYQSSSVAYGSSCTSEVRTCTNGVLSGSYQFGSCAVGTPASCTFNGLTITSGQSVTAYQAASVPYGSSCTSQVRTCTNGVLSGTYTYGSCSVSTPSTSAAGTSVPSSANIVDRNSDTWTLVGGVVYKNGTAAGFTANVIKLYWDGTSVYHEINTGAWWKWSGSAWVGASNPLPTSPAGTSIPSALEIVDNARGSWTVVGGVVYKNGSKVGYTDSVTKLYWNGTYVYQTIATGGWWYWNGTAWVMTAAAPY